MSRTIPIEEVLRAEVAHQTVFKRMDLTWDDAKRLVDRLDMLLAEVDGWAKFIGKTSSPPVADCLFELYPKRSAEKAWRIALGGERGV